MDGGGHLGFGGERQPLWLGPVGSLGGEAPLLRLWGGGRRSNWPRTGGEGGLRGVKKGRADLNE